LIPGIGINVPQDVTGPGYAAHLAGFSDRAVALGFDSLWVSESLRPGVVDPLTVLSFLAGRTQRVTLGVAVLVAGLRSPLRLAREVASIDQLSDGRVVVGVGVGNDRSDYDRHGIDPGHRGRHFEAGVTLLRRLLSEEIVTDNSPWWRLEDEPSPLRPLQRPAPPIWFGARAGEALRRAVRLGDGWIGAGSMSASDFLSALAEVRHLLAAQGRDPAGFSIAKRVYVHVTDSAVPAEVDRWFGHHYGSSRRREDVFVAGSADQVADHVAALRAAGVQTVVLHPVVEVRDQLEKLADVMSVLG
jgi:alkanesulfonate monooxygenase SsuD/methylene tetrahydromethanopterin reductase-like flavin-dependent oxidoreductase (luciferase family)